MPIAAVWSEAHRLHQPSGEVWVGVRIPGTEVPARGDIIRQALVEAGHPLLEPTVHGREVLETVHDPELLTFLESAWVRWEASGYRENPGMDRVVPYTFPHIQLLAGRPPRRPESVGAEAGLYAMDTMTLIGPGTWEATVAAADVALTAADLVVTGSPAVYAACRPPGHHAGRSFYGGSCYMNNAALAAQRLIDLGVAAVAVVDIDAHHGNGTQQIFWTRRDVRYGSVHIDPGCGWYPHFAGYAEETGQGAGLGATRNFPLPPAAGDTDWLPAVERLASFAEGADALVVSLGVDAAEDDPESPLRITADGYHSAGMILGEMQIPTVVVQEGGYHLPTLGLLVVEFLEGLERGR